MDYVTIVEQTVKQFYAEGNNEAHLWLLQVQASHEAWTFVWELLDSSKPWEVQFFAATTLHAKITKQWDEVPRNDYPALQERLLNIIKQPSTPKFILSKLCETLAGFFVNSRAVEEREKDKSLVDEIVETLPYSSPAELELLLRVLTLLPAEFERRQQSKCVKRCSKSLSRSWSKTVWLLQQVFTTCNPNAQGSDSTLYLLAIECALPWLNQLGLEATGQIYPHLLVAAAHYAPSRDCPNEENSRDWQMVQECLIVLVSSYELHSRPQTLWEWARSLVAMAQQYREKYFCEILSAMGQNNSREFVIALADEGTNVKKSTSEGLIELLLECLEQEGRYPTDETRSAIPFGFWYSLQDQLYALDPPLDNQAQIALKPIYARLAQALLRKSTLPSSPSEEGDERERELFRCYRQDIADTLNYCYNILEQDLLVLLGQRLSQPFDGSEKWTDVESTLHAFQALADTPDKSHCIPALMDLVVSHIPYDLYPGKVLVSACSTIGAYAGWIGEHPNPWLERVLPIVTLGLTRDSETAIFASMALKDLVTECDSHFAPFAPSILNMIGQMLPKVAPGRGEGLRLMYAAGKLLETLPSIEEQMVHLEAILGLCIVKIREWLKQPLFVSRVAVINQLKMATMFFSTLTGPIGQAVLGAFLPIFNQIVRHPEWGQDNATLEAMHTCAQRSLSSLLHPEVDARPLLPILENSYKIWPHPAALNLLRQLVLLFGKDPENIIGPVLAELSSVTLSGIRACRSVRGNLSDWSDLMEAYLGLLAQICKKNVRMLLQISDQIPEMLQCGIACLALPETVTAKAAVYFLCQAIMQMNPHLESFIQPVGQHLVNVMFQCVAGQTPRSHLELFAEVFVALLKNRTDWTCQWVRVALQEQPGLSSIRQSEKDALLQCLYRRVNRMRIYDVLKELSFQCRR